MNDIKPKRIIIRGKRHLVIVDLITLPWVFFHPETPKKVVWLEPS